MDERGQGSADRLTPAQSEAVRRLLAAARDDEGIPQDVAARLDSTLSELSAERAGVAPATVVPLRRRRWPQVLVAAAAVVLVGYGTAQLAGLGEGLDGAGGDADTAGEPAAVRPEPESEDNRGGSPGDEAPSAPQATDDAAVAEDFNGLQRLTETTLSNLGVKGLEQIGRDTLERDLKALAPSAAEGSDTGGYDARRAGLQCGPYYTVDGGETFAASYRRHLALVLFHPELDGLRLVEIYDCESGTPRRAARTVTLRAGE